MAYLLKPKITEDVGGTLYFIPPTIYQSSLNAAGDLPSSYTATLPDSATCALYDRDGGVLRSASSATVSTIDTTLSAGASRGATSITVTSATGITPGLPIVLLTSEGTPELVGVRSVSGTTVQLVRELAQAYDASDVVVGAWVSDSVTSTEADARGQNYRARWVVTWGSASIPYDQLFDVVSTPENWTLSLDVLLTLYPWIGDVAFEDDDPLGERLIDTAYSHRLIPMLRSRGVEISRVRDNRILESLHAALVAEQVKENDFLHRPSDEQQRALDFISARVSREFDLLSSNIGWYDKDDDLLVDETESTYRPTARLLR